jgi:thiamine transport system permease protein
MAKQPFPLTAGLIGLCLALLTLGTAIVVMWHGNGLRFAAADAAALHFTLLQAALSALLAVGLAVPLARALARRRFVGRGALITLLGAPFLLPVIVAVLGLLAVFGRAGWVNDVLALAGLPPLSIYGLQGVVIAHVFLNLPLATRMILQGWQSIPAERLRLAATLDLPPIAVFRHLEWPMLRNVLPGAFVTILAICLTSFATALTLGGGPRATTVELAIYQALRFEFDLGHAAGLATLQFMISAIAAAVAWSLAPAMAFGAGLDRGYQLAPSGWRQWGDGLVILLATAFLALPMLAILLRGMAGWADLPNAVWPAAARSLAIAVPSALLATTAALGLALAVARGGPRWLDLAAVLPLATSSLVLGTGLFLLVQPLVPVATLALPVTLLVNAALSLPFVYRLLLPDAQALHRDFHRLTAALAIPSSTALAIITLPRLARPLGFGMGVAAALSLGDLGVIALFAGEAQATLPLVIHRLMGAYQMQAAAAAALLLVGIGFALFALFDLGGRRAATR